MGSGSSLPEVTLTRQKVVIVTGGNTGLGYETAKWIAFRGATVIIACRSEERAKKAIQRMQVEYETAKREGQVGLAEENSLAVEFMSCDLASFKSVKEFAGAFLATGRPLHTLICNAGLGASAYSETGDGLESMLQVNYLSQFLLVAKLLPLMLKSGEDCRIVNVSSFVHRHGNFDTETIFYKGRESSFDRMDYYGRTKLYQIMQACCMTRRLKGTSVTYNSINPGIVATEINRAFNDHCFYHCLDVCVRCCGIAKKSEVGAETQILVAVDPKIKGVSGEYFANCKTETPSRPARDKVKQEAIWKITIDSLKDHLTAEDIECLETPK